MESLGSANEHFRLLVETVRDYAIFMLDPSGRVASWNEGARRIKGYTADEIVGQHFSKFYRPEDVERGVCQSELEAALRDGRYEDFGWRVRKDGSQFWANVVITPLRDVSGKHIGFAKITRDMTDRAYRTFIEATNAIVWTTDASGRPNADSPSWRLLTGQTESDWRATGFDAVHPDDRGALERLWTNARSERSPFRAEFRVRRRDGAYQWVETSAVPLFDRDGNVREWFGVTLDISVRKAAEAEREAAFERERTSRLEAEHVQAELATTLSSIGDAVIVTDAQGNVTFLNAVAEKLTRWSVQAARGRPLPEVFPIVNEETRRPVLNPVEKVLREGVIVGLANHTVLVRRDGSDVPIDDSAAPIRDSQGNLFGVVMVFRDVSAKKREGTRRDFLLRAGEALMSSPDYHDSLATIAHLAVPRLADWCAVQILEPGETKPREIAVAHVDPAKVNAAREMLRKFPTNPRAQLGASHAIRSGRAELHRHIDDGFLELIAVSDEHRQLLNRLELRSAMVIPLRGRERVFGAMTFVFAESHREYSDDDLVFAEELARRAGVVIERRKLEEERAQLLERERVAREQAEVANRAKDEFLATVSHELRNPLSTILGWAKMMAASADLPERLHEPVKTIERNARAQQRLIDDMLDVSRIISGKLRLQIATVDVAQTIADGVEAQRRAADAKGVRITTHVAPGIGAEADAVRLQQIVTNLVANAVKFTPRGGAVEVTAACDGTTLEIRVSDNGEGIDPRRLTAIFEPFRQEDASTTRRHGGLGLGLAIVRELAVAHGGSVRAESPGKGKGATFIVELPAQCATEVSPSTPPPARAMPRLDGTCVLVVDDDEDAVALLSQLLANVGASTETATSAEQALEKVRRIRPDVIVSDIGMPNMDGYDLMRRVRALPASEGGRTPAIAVTAYARPDDAERAFAAGFQRHVPKPIDPAEMVFALANLAGLPLDVD